MKCVSFNCNNYKEDKDDRKGSYSKNKGWAPSFFLIKGLDVKGIKK